MITKILDRIADKLSGDSIESDSIHAALQRLLDLPSSAFKGEKGNDGAQAATNRLYDDAGSLLLEGLSGSIFMRPDLGLISADADVNVDVPNGSINLSQVGANTSSITGSKTVDVDGTIAASCSGPYSVYCEDSMSFYSDMGASFGSETSLYLDAEDGAYLTSGGGIDIAAVGSTTITSDLVLLLRGDEGVRMLGLKSGLDQASAGAGVGEIWLDTTDASRPRLTLGV